MGKRIAICLMLVSASVNAFSEGNYDNETNRGILACTKENFIRADKELDVEYANLSERYSGVDLDDLKSAQRSWVLYRGRYCQAAFSAVGVGAEANIDKWQCMYYVTSARVRELKYIRSEYSASDFYHAIKFIANEYENGDLSRVIDKLAKDSGGKGDDYWRKYVEKNCKIAYAKLSEESNVCAARMNFYRDWY